METKQNFKPMIKAKQPKEMAVEQRVQNLRDKRASFRRLAERAKSPERRKRFEQKGKGLGIEIRKEHKGGK